MNPQASWWGTCSADEVDDAEQDMACHLKGSFLPESFLQIRRRTFEVPLKGAAQQRFLISERRVEARAIDAHCLREVGDGSRNEAFSPKEKKGLVQGLVWVEAAGPSDGGRPFCFRSCSAGPH